ncbi:MAG: DUF58 domain-containing protein [Myxococcota bacterium]
MSPQVAPAKPPGTRAAKPPPRHGRPTSMLWTVPGCLAQTVGVFVLPFKVALPAGLVFELSEVVQTLPALLALTAILLAPVTVVQILGIFLKSRKELAFLAARARAVRLPLRRGALPPRERGQRARVVLLLGGLLTTLIALGLKWASLGILAVLSLLLFYLVVGWTLFVSTFLARTFESGMGRADAGITRRMLPAVAHAGDSVEEVVSLRRVPVPWGYVLVVEDPNPPRLRTETRYAVGATARSGEIEARGFLRATPRGFYHLGPARIAYQDLLGITRVSVASVATAELKVLPKLMPVVIVDPPRSPLESPDVVTRPHRYPTEDHFRFREYLPGDDVRRIHWRLSMRAGQLHVRLPETKETSTERIVLLLDSYLPPGKLLDASHGGEEILDALVLAWLGIARELVDRGNRVTLLAAVTKADGTDVVTESIDARGGAVARWQDLGARARWQPRFDLPAMLASIGDDMHGVVVTARFTAPPPGNQGGQTTTWLMMDPADALGKPDRHWLWDVVGLPAGAPASAKSMALLRWVVLLPHPVGSDENHFARRVGTAWQLRRRWHARRVLRILAQQRAGRTVKEVRARGDAVYRIERTPTAIRLLGIASRKAS